MHHGNKYSAKHKHCITQHQREYNSWYSMKQRCLNPEKDNYSSYGGRGIKICQRWIDSFDNFVEDMGLRPQGTTLDRINSSGNYEPSNCRWSTYSEQTINTTATHWIDDNGEKICLAYFAKKYKVHPTTIRYRIKNGLSLDDLKKQPDEKLIHEIWFKGECYSQRSIAKEYNLPKTTFRRKIASGMSVVQAICYVMNKKGMNVSESDFVFSTRKYDYKAIYA